MAREKNGEWQKMKGNGRTDPASHYFRCGDSERAVFEAGIKLGTIYHQFIGAPVSMANVRNLEKTIEHGTLVQPFVKSVCVRIEKRNLCRGRGVYRYKTLTGSMLHVRLTISYNGTEADCEMRTVPEINYPLMFIRSIRHTISGNPVKGKKVLRRTGKKKQNRSIRKVTADGGRP